MEKGHAESTIEATIYVIQHNPEGLKAWLARHEDGLEDVARARLLESEKRRLRLEGQE